MEGGHNGLKSEMHSEDDNVLVEMNKKRTVKTPAQTQILERYYNLSRYPPELTKIDISAETGLTEKQVSGWFCHRRLKEKRLWDSHVAERQDRMSGVIQDRGSGHRQDSCGSTKLGDDRNFDTREVESGRVTLPEHQVVEYGDGGHHSGDNNRMDEASSGSSSSLKSMPNHQTEYHFDVANSGFLVPKFPTDVPGAKPRPGPSGYLKLKRPLENPAITLVKRQLGNLFQDDGPPLGVAFDPLPPGSFESAQDPVDGEACRAGEVLLASPDVSKSHQHSKFGKGIECGSSMPSLNPKMGRATLKVPQGSDVPENYGPHKFKQNSSPNNGGYNPWRSPEISGRDLSGSDSRGDNGLRHRCGAENTRVSPVSTNCHQQLLGGKFRGNPKSSFLRHSEAGRKSFQGENIEGHPANLYMKEFEHLHFAEKMQPRQIAKDGKIYAGRGITIGNQVEVPYNNVIMVASKRPRPQIGVYLQPEAANPVGAYQAIRPMAGMLSSTSEEGDDGSEETSSSIG